MPTEGEPYIYILEHEIAQETLRENRLRAFVELVDRHDHYPRGSQDGGRAMALILRDLAELAVEQLDVNGS